MKITSRTDYAANKRKLTTEPKGSGNYKRVNISGRVQDVLVIGRYGYTMELSPGVDLGDRIIKHVQHFAVSLDGSDDNQQADIQGRLI